VRHVRMLGLCLVAALALGAYAVSSASALEWGKCENVGSGGNYAGPNCSKAEKAKPKGTGSYEWRKASEVAEKRVAEGKTANVPFSGESVGSGGLLTTGDRECGSGTYAYTLVTRAKCVEGGGTVTRSTGLSVECEQETNTGEAEGKNKVANVNVSFKGCTIFGSIPCTGLAGEEVGEVNTSTLKGKLGWIKKANKEVGVLLEPAQKHGHFADFACLEGAVATHVGVGNKKEGAEYVKGELYPEGCSGICPGATPTEEKHGGYDEIISPITPVNQMTNQFTQVYTSTETGESALEPENIPNKFEGKHISLLEDYVVFEEEPESLYIEWSPASEEITNVNTPEEEGEIKA
jgi:hypothetical protein